MPGVKHAVTTTVPRDQVFAYVDDYRYVPDWMFGVSDFAPIDPNKVSGLGATYHTAMKVGPKTLTSTVKVTEWVHNEVIVLTSIAGFDIQTAWRFADAEDGGTLVEASFDYKLPGGLAGRALGAIIEPFVQQAVKHTETALRAGVEGQN